PGASCSCPRRPCRRAPWRPSSALSPPRRPSSSPRTDRPAGRPVDSCATAAVGMRSQRRSRSWRMPRAEDQLLCRSAAV
uniref:Uncharacterized protein n=1 Tax=Aegilops tauschii subsp. strangulata TaxID=200361 RepID=A0A453SW44_AEGTS